MRIERIFQYVYILDADKTDLLIMDSFFPHPLSLFRYAEFDTYLDHFDTLVYTTGESLALANEKGNIKFFIDHYPKKNKVKIFKRERPVTAKLAATIFLNETFSFLPYIEKNKIPFIFTLYPGGGFKMYDAESDRKLKRILSSPFFRKVIATQNITRNYLLDNAFCKEDDIEFIYGAPSNWETPGSVPSRKNKEQKTFDICFVAAKYSIGGIDKGYDIFIEVAKKLSVLSDKFRFHVAGGFSEQDMDVSMLENRITFHGYLTIDKLRNFYADKDIIISPNRANTLASGAFDGFPTGCVLEAGICGTVMLLTDELSQNTILDGNIDCVFIDHDPDHTVSKVMELFLNYDSMTLISRNGSNVLRYFFSNDYQMTPRLRLISSYLNSKK